MRQPLTPIPISIHINTYSSPTMSTPKKNYTFNTETVKLSCSDRLSTLFRRRRSSSISRHTKPTTTYSPSAANTPPPYYSSDTESEIKSFRAVQGFGRLGGESVAVEKDSDDPYLDFRRSMMQMILEKELYSRDDLKELLDCFLQLNSPYYHGIIIRAFTEIWNGVDVGDGDF